MNDKTANRLFEYRKKNGFSQEELAAKIGVSRQAISKWERGESSPDTDNLIALAQLYQVTIDELINGKNTPEKTVYNEDNTQQEYTEEYTEEAENDNTDDKTAQTSGVSFKNGIHVHNGTDNVDIDFTGIHVETQKGESVHVDLNGVQVKGVDDEYIFKRSKKENLFHALLPITVIIAYLIIGFMFEQGWALGWLLILLIPILESLIAAVKTKNPSAFAYPVFTAAIFLTIGMFEKIWHPTWLIFLTIPVYYIIADFFKPEKKKQ